MVLAMGLSHIAFIMNYISSILNDSLHYEKNVGFLKIHIIREKMLINFIFHFLIVVYHIYQFACVEPLLPQGKNHLLWYTLFLICLYLVC